MVKIILFLEKIVNYKCNHVNVVWLQIDNVGNPSWQAQITGIKEWTLQPPAKCYHMYPNQVKVMVNPDDISKHYIYSNQVKVMVSPCDISK